MRILVTGGCGFIGSNFVKHMVKNYPDYEITNYDKLTYAGDKSNVSECEFFDNYHFVKGDICDYEKLKKTIKSLDINVIVNFAAESHVDNSIENSDEFIQTNINGTHTLLKLLHEFPIMKFVQISTDEVYGALGEHSSPFTEHTSLAPNSPYAASKAAADMLCRSFYETYHYPIVITRSSNNYGPNQHKEKLIPKLIHNIKEGKKVPIYGDGKNIRDWVHVYDHCNAIDVVLHEGKIGEVYNIGGECEKRNIQIVDHLLLNFEQSYDLVEYVEDRKGHDWRYAMDISKIKNELGWKPKVKFETGIGELMHISMGWRE
jgi:dTDP-glucose 4,6-dehydratase|tara:strand:- start:812 stop:1762 length:951 start_codon:yes stop_codon:yes gene_type:complete